MNTVKELKEIVSRLEALTGNSNASKAADVPSFPAMTEFDQAFQLFVESAEHTNEAAVKDMTHIVEKVFNQMKVVLSASFNMKKPDAAQVKTISQALKATVDPIAKFGSNPNLNFHVKMVLEGCNAVFWVLSDMAGSTIDSSIEPADYMLLKIRQQKVAEMTKWGDSLVRALKALKQYQQNNFKMGLDWNFNGTQTVDDVLATLKGGVVSAPPKKAGGPPPPPPPAPVALAAAQPGQIVDKNALFAELNQGLDITKRLKKVDKSAPSDNTSAAPIQKKVVVEKVQGVVKVARKYCKENWIVENFINESLIEFSEEETDMKQSIFIDNCQNCGIIIKPKVKSIFLQNCSKIQLVFDSLVSGIELIGCKRIEVTALNKCPSFMVDNSESIHLTFAGNKDCEILSTKTMEFNINYQMSEGEYSKDSNVPEQFFTYFDHQTNQFVTRAHEAHFG